MEHVLSSILLGAVAIHVFLWGVALWRVWQGENVIDRLIGVELMSTLTLALLVLLAVIQARTLYMDVALAFAALGYVGTIALAKYAAEEEEIRLKDLGLETEPRIGKQ